MYEETTEKLLEFISSSPTAFHAAETIRKRFLEEGFTELKEEEHWELEKAENILLCEIILRLSVFLFQ